MTKYSKNTPEGIFPSSKPKVIKILKEVKRGMVIAYASDEIIGLFTSLARDMLVEIKDELAADMEKDCKCKKPKSICRTCLGKI